MASETKYLIEVKNSVTVYIHWNSEADFVELTADILEARACDDKAEAEKFVHELNPAIADLLVVREHIFGD